MKQETLARTIIETMIRKFFRDIENDPDRSIRNIIDLAINFSKGRFQKEFFQVLQEMLSNEQSAYYELVRNVVADNDHEHLMTFGMNVGFQACTIGANTIRENEDKWNFNIPWTYHLMYGTEGLSCEAAEKIITEGKELGTYIYMLSLKGQICEEHAELLERHRDCAFVLFLSPRTMLEDPIDILKDKENLFVLIKYEPEFMEEATDELQKHHFFFGIYESCKKGQQASLLSAEHLEQIARTRVPFYVLMPEDPYDYSEDQELHDQVTRIRTQQEYPFVILDYISDIQKIDRIISNDSCAVSFDAEGCVHTDTGKWNGDLYNIHSRSLFEILNIVTKKK